MSKRKSIDDVSKFALHVRKQLILFAVFIVNLYSFKRVKGDCDAGTYTHPYFVRGKPELCCFMNRAKIKKKGKGDKNTNKNTNVNSTTAEPFACTYPVEIRADRSKEIVLGSNDMLQNVSSPTPQNSSYSNQMPPMVVDDSSFSPIPMRQTSSLHQLSVQKDEILLPPGVKQSQYGLWNSSPANLYEQNQIFIGQLKSSSRVPETGKINTSCNLLNNCGHVAHGIDLDLDTIFDDTVVNGSSNI